MIALERPEHVSAARGALVGLAICAAFWAGVLLALIA